MFKIFKLNVYDFKKYIGDKDYKRITFKRLIDYLKIHENNPYDKLNNYNVRVSMSMIAYWLSISCGKEVPVLSYLLTSIKF